MMMLFHTYVIVRPRYVYKFVNNIVWHKTKQLMLEDISREYYLFYDIFQVMCEIWCDEWI